MTSQRSGIYGRPRKQTNKRNPIDDPLLWPRVHEAASVRTVVICESDVCRRTTTTGSSSSCGGATSSCTLLSCRRTRSDSDTRGKGSDDAARVHLMMRIVARSAARPPPPLPPSTVINDQQRIWVQMSSPPVREWEGSEQPNGKVSV